MYKNFACAYGTLWLVMLSLAVLTQSHVNTGAFGLFGFPVIAIIYALIKKQKYENETDQEALIKHLQDKVYSLERQLLDSSAQE